VSEQGLTSHPTQYRSFCGRPFQAECTQAHNNGTVSLTFTETQNTKKKQAKPKIVRTAEYNCAYVLIMAVLIIFPVILQTDINVIMLSIGG